MTRLIWSISLLACALTAQAETAEDKGTRIALQADQANAGWVSERARLDMLLVNAQGDETTRQLTIDTLEGDSDGDRSRVQFESPADVRGTRMLTWSHKTGNDDQWLYLPAVKRVKRINAANKSGAFMGSELAYEDLGSQEPEKYRYRWLQDSEVNGRACDLLERVPVSRQSGYARHVLCLDREYQLPLHIDYFDRKNELLKTSVYSQHSRHGAVWKIDAIEVRNVQTGKRTLLTWSEREVGIGLDPRDFEPSALED